ncbi:MAG: valine--tRNA ligase [Candidatus Altiarchaeales archaeon ex4484_96]|nr:MAG: valine--tRNA ligase [Candidatus Altiarchaeales archaeon ex4484_96]
MGHIYNHTWIDIAARYKRMRGYEVYFPQGFDCHGLPTELKVEKELGVRKENREDFIDKCISWTEKAINRMSKQFDDIGYSTDWSLTYRTMDDDYMRLIQETLLEFYSKGILYRAKHPVLWCPRCETALAKAEVGYVECEGKLYHIDLLCEGHRLTIATTRPEMMPSCVAVFIHPDDDRYARYEGKKALLPIYGREVPIIADEAVEMEFGTGVVYLCTFGDEQDIAWQKKYRLPVIESIDSRGIMTGEAGKYAGLSILEARKEIAEDLIEDGHIRKIEKLTHSVLSHTERSSCKSPIELIPLYQWFINVKDYLKQVVESSQQMGWHPSYMLGRMIDWTETMDWPRDDVRVCSKCGAKKAVGVGDVADCWVDSSVTPLVISGWNRNDELFDKTYPVSLRPQGYEIIRTWAFYTIYRCMLLTGDKCFDELLINGMVAGPDGRKMSKSLGNVIEPEEPLEKYCADTIRQWAAGGTPGDDYPFSWEECDHSQRFLIKLWNISRFIMMHLEDYDGEEDVDLRDVDYWILSKLQVLVSECSVNLDKYVFNIPLTAIRSFLWHDFADNYLEMVKHRLYKPEIYGEDSRRAAQHTLKRVLETVLLLLSPYTPHISEEIWDTLVGGYCSLSSWPKADKSLISEDALAKGELLVEVISEIRRFKSEHQMSLGAELALVEIQADSISADKIKSIEPDIKATGRINELKTSVSDKVDGFGLRIK